MTDKRKIELTPTSHIVLGLLSLAGDATPYELKRAASATVGQFWSLAHSQLYAEPARLAKAGYLTETREPDGRRRKLYSLTERGREALDAWLGVIVPEPYFLRDPALLKLFFGADAKALARAQVEVHSRQLAEYEQLREAGVNGPSGPALALELGIRHERETVRFWEEQL
jgi:PadR family transcriptional regulator, regulatory protein AphA